MNGEVWIAKLECRLQRGEDADVTYLTRQESCRQVDDARVETGNLVASGVGGGGSVEVKSAELESRVSR